MDVAVDVLFQHMLALVLAASFGMLTSRIAWRKGFYALPPEIPLDRRIPLGKLTLQVFGIFLSAELLFVPLLYLIWMYMQEGRIVDLSEIKQSISMQALINLIAIGAAAVALVAFFVALKPSVREAIWGSSPQKKTLKQNLYDFFLGSTTWLLVYPWVVAVGQLISMIVALFYTGPLSDQAAVKHLKEIAEHPALFGMTVLAVITVVPFLEELLFRGFLQSWLKSVSNRSIAIGLTSLIFASFHFSISQGIENIEFLVSLFLLSCFLGFVKERQKSLWASVGLHATFNFISVLMLFGSGK